MKPVIFLFGLTLLVAIISINGESIAEAEAIPEAIPEAESEAESEAIAKAMAEPGVKQV